VRGRVRGLPLLPAGRAAPASLLIYGCLPPHAADEANKLMAWADKADVQELLNFFVVVTKQDKLAHVVLATSDHFFMSWLEKGT
jgi:alpha/beta superfamily hydrolase